jgi:hypothetical protein
MVSINSKVGSVAVVGAAAAAIGLGVSAAARADTPTPTPSPTSSSQGTNPGTPGAPGQPGYGTHPGKGWGPGGRFGGPGRGTDLSLLASKLGVDEAKLQDALKAVKTDLRNQLKASGKSGTPGTPGAPGTPAPGTKPDLGALQDQFAQLLASQLGLDVNTVKTALAEVRAAAVADRQKAFDDRLAQAVKDGKLTQAEADAVKKAAKEGIIGMGYGPR